MSNDQFQAVIPNKIQTSPLHKNHPARYDPHRSRSLTTRFTHHSRLRFRTLPSPIRFKIPGSNWGHKGVERGSKRRRLGGAWGSKRGRNGGALGALLLNKKFLKPEIQSVYKTSPPAKTILFP